VPPATVDRPTAYRRAFVAAPGLDPGGSVVVTLTGSGDGAAGATTSVTDRGTATRPRVQTRAVAPLPVVAGRVPTDADCDGILEDFDGDGTVTDGDLRAFFERRGGETLRVQRPRFDANDDSVVNVHDVQAVLADVENRSDDSPDGPIEETEPGVDFESEEISVLTNDTRTVDIVVPNVSVGAFNLSVRAEGESVSVLDVEAPGSDYEAHRNQTTGSVLVAAGHGDGNQIATVTLAGAIEGETSVVLDVTGVSDDGGRLYATPGDGILSVNVSTDTDSGNGDDPPGDGPPENTETDGPPENTETDGPDGSETRESAVGVPAVLIVVSIVVVAGGAGAYYLRRRS
jgi:hypothetical protein